MWITTEGAFERVVGAWRIRSDPLGRAGAGAARFHVTVTQADDGATLAVLESDRLAPRLWSRPDGGVNLALVQGGESIVLLLDPDSGKFRAAGGPDEPIAALAERVARIREACETYERWESPDGTLRIETEYIQWHLTASNSAPRITDLRSGEIVLDLLGTRWDGVPEPTADGGARMRLGPDDDYDRFRLVFDPPNGTFSTVDEAGDASAPRPLGELVHALMRSDCVASEAAIARVVVTPASPTPAAAARPLRGWWRRVLRAVLWIAGALMALYVLLVAFALIAD